MTLAVDETLRIPVTEVSQTALARRTIAQMAKRAGFGEGAEGKVAIVVTELCGNLVKHSSEGGELLARRVSRAGIQGLEVLSLDKGPGIADLAGSMYDGFSTSGSPGEGLGAVRRLADAFDAYSAPGLGTAVLAQLWSRSPSREPAPRIEVGAWAIAKEGEPACGDAFSVAETEDRYLIMLADGLGHGPDAARASTMAVRSFEARAELAPGSILREQHLALTGTRGAAVAIAELNPQRMEIRYCGLGNIEGTIVDPSGNHHMISMNGIVGHESRRIQEFVYPWSSEAIVVMHSDGLATHWNLASYPGLIRRHPAVVAGILYRDFTRGYDDVSVLVASLPGT